MPPVGVEPAPFALLAEDLALEPVDLVLEGLDFLAHRPLDLGQAPQPINDLLRAHRRRFSQAREGDGNYRFHAAIISQVAV